MIALGKAIEHREHEHRGKDGHHVRVTVPGGICDACPHRTENCAERSRDKILNVATDPAGGKKGLLISFPVWREKGQRTNLGCTISHAVTTAHHVSYWFHHPRLCWAQAGTASETVSKHTLTAYLVSNP